MVISILFLLIKKDQEAHENWYPIYPVFSTNADLSLQQVEGGMKTVSDAKETVTLGSIRLKLKYTVRVPFFFYSNICRKK